MRVQGESYAGMYVPTLALQVLEHNTEHDAAKAASLVPDAPKINLKGILVGNGAEKPSAVFWRCHFLKEKHLHLPRQARDKRIPWKR